MKKILTSLAAVLAVVIAGWLQQLDSSSPPAAGTEQAAPARTGTGAVADAFARRQSDRILEDAGRIEKVLPDDNDGSRHQRLILRLDGGSTVLIAHNIDLAPRLPDPQPGDWVRFKGEYEWSERGGVVHWTHHDPKQWREGGWLEYRGKRYE